MKPEISQDEKVSGLSRDARLLFYGLITIADDEGRFRARRSELVGWLYPDDDDAFGLIDQWVAEIKETGMVLFYVHDGRPYGAFRNWRKHQKINKPTPSELPPPPDRRVVKTNRVTPYDADGNFKKSAIPERVRREVARREGGIPGEATEARCHWCGAPGQISWSQLADGRPGSWVSFQGLELDHVQPESAGGASDAANIVLACSSCNRRRGHRHGTGHPDITDSVTTSVIRDHGNPRADPIRSDPIHVVFDYWKERVGKPRAKLTDPRRKKIIARLNEGYSIEDIKRGIDGAAINPPRGDDGVIHDDLVSVCRTGDQLERYQQRATPPPAAVNGNGRNGHAAGLSARDLVAQDLERREARA